MSLNGGGDIGAAKLLGAARFPWLLPPGELVPGDLLPKSIQPKEAGPWPSRDVL